MSARQEPDVRIVPEGEPPVRLDKYLARIYPELSRSRLQKLIEQGCILVNGQEAKPSLQIGAGDKIHVTIPPAEPVPLIPESIPVDVVYEDKDLLVLNKPAGLVVHPAPGHSSHTLVNALLHRCPGLADFDGSTRPGIVHRLDRDTSGLMVIAKNSVVQRYLVNQFRTRSVSKSYLVLVKGRLSPEKGIIDAPLGRDPSNRKRMAVVSGGREARTRYRVLEYLDNHTLLDVTTETGRTHQIRVHFSAVRYPVVGDPVYGVKSTYVQRQFIHAYRLRFRMPGDGEYKEFTCDLPSDLKQAIKLIGGRDFRLPLTIA